MTLEINFEPSNEELTMILDDATILKVTLGSKGELVLNSNFRDLEDENNDLYNALRKITRELFALDDSV